MNNVKISEYLKEIIGKIYINTFDINTNNILQFVEENKDKNNKFIRYLLIYLGDLFREKKIFNKKNLTINEIKNDFSKWLNNKLKEINYNLSKEKKKKLILNFTKEIYNIYKNDIDNELRNSKDILIELIKKKLNKNKINIITDVRTYKEFEELNKMKIIMLIPTANKKLQMDEKLVNKVIDIINNSKNLNAAIEKLKNTNIVLPLEELNTILTIYYTNQNKIKKRFNELNNLDILIINSERKDRNVLIEELIKIQNFIKNDKNFLFMGISKAGKDTIFQMLSIIYNNKSITNSAINEIDFNKIEEEINDILKNSSTFEIFQKKMEEKIRKNPIYNILYVPTLIGKYEKIFEKKVKIKQNQNETILKTIY